MFALALFLLLFPSVPSGDRVFVCSLCACVLVLSLCGSCLCVCSFFSQVVCAGELAAGVSPLPQLDALPLMRTWSQPLKMDQRLQGQQQLQRDGGVQSRAEGLRKWLGVYQQWKTRTPTGGPSSATPPPGSVMFDHNHTPHPTGSHRHSSQLLVPPVNGVSNFLRQHTDAVAVVLTAVRQLSAT